MFGVQVQQITEPEPEQRFRFSVSMNLNIVFQTEHFLGIPSQNFRDFFWINHIIYIYIHTFLGQLGYPCILNYHPSSSVSTKTYFRLVLIIAAHPIPRQAVKIYTEPKKNLFDSVSIKKTYKKNVARAQMTQNAAFCIVWAHYHCRCTCKLSSCHQNTNRTKNIS